MPFDASGLSGKLCVLSASGDTEERLDMDEKEMIEESEEYKLSDDGEELDEGEGE